MTLDFRPASSLSSGELADLFTDGFSGYYVPIRADAAAIEGMTRSWDLDLDASRVAFGDDGRPLGFALLGVRGRRGWIGGTGVVPAARRRGVGDAVMRAVLDEARRLGLDEVWLEVLVQNEPARRLYEELGFEHVRGLELWELQAGDEPAAAGSTRPVDVDEALRTIAALRTQPEPWQRADETLANTADLRAVAVDGGAAVYRVAGERASVLQLAGDAAAARALLVALLAEAPGVFWLNVPDGDPALEALAALGGRVTERQHELRKSL